MTLDLPLAAVCVGFIWYGVRSRPAVYGILTVAPLVRETGMLLIAGWCAYNVLRRNWGRAGAGAACAIPALAWWTYVASRTSPDGTVWLARYPLAGLIERTIAGAAIPSASLWLRTAAVTEILALIGVWAAFVLTVYIAWRNPWGLVEITAVACAAFASMLGKYDIWDSAYAVGRTLAPSFVFLAICAIRDRRFALLLPVLLILPRVLLQYEAQIASALRRISG
jgi:hypothetical protein